MGLYKKNTDIQLSDIQSELISEIIRALYGEKLMAQFMPLLFLPFMVFSVFFYIVLNKLSFNLIVCSVTIFALAYLGRYLLVAIYFKDKAADSQEGWLLKFRIATGCCGLAWGISGILLMLPNDNVIQSIMLMIFAGISVAAVVAFAIDRVTLNAFVFTVLVTIAPRYLMIGGLSSKMALLIILFICFMVISTRKLTKSLHENIRLRIHADKSNEVHNALAQRQKLHIELTPMGVIEWDTDFRVRAWNSAAERIFGYTAEEAINQYADFIVPGSLKGHVFDVMGSLVSNLETNHSRNQNVRKDNQVIDCEWFNTRLKDSAGKVIGIASLVQDITAYNRALEDVQRLAYFDALTNLPNRRLMLDRLQHALVQSERTQSYGCLMFIDLDNFKTLNDTKGHAVGDLLLKEVSIRLQKALRAVDTIARIGGDEFVFVLENLGTDYNYAIAAASFIADKVIREFHYSFNLNTYEHRCSPSIGICMFLGQDVNGDDILKHADTAMYQTKRAGRNHWRFYDENMQPVLDLRANLKNDLSLALSHSQLELYFQMQVDKLRSITGAEVLLRWKHPELGMVSPAEFIPLAEESGLIISIGTWVLEQACKQLFEWSQSPAASHLRLSINVSALQFSQPDFVKVVSQAIEKSKCNGALLTLELTENLVMQDINDVITKMLALKQIGVLLSMDDFGMGYSSLSHLKRLPLDELKVDKSFVHDALASSDDALIVQTIITMGKKLGLSIIAEGVETVEQMAFLHESGCEAFQGYLFGKPVDLKSFQEHMGMMHTSE